MLKPKIEVKLRSWQMEHCLSLIAWWTTCTLLWWQCPTTRKRVQTHLDYHHSAWWLAGSESKYSCVHVLGSEHGNFWSLLRSMRPRISWSLASLNKLLPRFLGWISPIRNHCPVCFLTMGLQLLRKWMCRRWGTRREETACRWEVCRFHTRPVELSCTSSFTQINVDSFIVSFSDKMKTSRAFLLHTVNQCQDHGIKWEFVFSWFPTCDLPEYVFFAMLVSKSAQLASIRAQWHWDLLCRSWLWRRIRGRMCVRVQQLCHSSCHRFVKL